MDNRIDGSSEHLACLVENISNDIQNYPTGFQSFLQQADSVVFLLGGCENWLVQALLPVCGEFAFQKKIPLFGRKYGAIMYVLFLSYIVYDIMMLQWSATCPSHIPVQAYNTPCRASILYECAVLRFFNRSLSSLRLSSTSSTTISSLSSFVALSATATSLTARLISSSEK